MSVIVVATIVPVPEHREAVIAAYEQAIPRVHAEDAGCELYALTVNDERLVMVEKWASPEALQAHATSPAIQECRAATAGKILGTPDVQVLSAHPAGTSAQGSF